MSELPTSAELQHFFDQHNLSSRGAGKLLGIKSSSVRHWLTGRKTIPLTMWVILQETTRDRGERGE